MSRHLPLLRALLLALAAVLPARAACAGAGETLRIGVFAYRPGAVMQARFQPLADYLSARLPGVRVELAILGLAELQAAVDQHRLDLVLTNPRHYLQLRSRSSLTGVIATLVKRGVDGSPTASLGGVILARADRNDIARLADLRGKRIAVPDTEHTGGYMAPVYELREAGLPPPPAARTIVAGSHDGVVDLVLSGAADAGFVRTEILEELMLSGRLPAAALKVINRQRLAGFPFASSTRLYPEWPVVALPHLDQRTTSRLMAALLTLDPNDPAALQANIAGFAPPADYWPVEQAARKLRLAPFDHVPPYTPSDIWRDYRAAVLGAAAAIVAILVLSLLLARRNRVLAEQTRALAETAEQQRRARLVQIAIGEAVATLMVAAAPERDRAVEHVLGVAAALLSADRAYLFQRDADGEHFSNSHEWCAAGIDCQRAVNQRVPIAATRWWWDELLRKGIVLIDDVAALPDATQDFRVLLQRQGIRSLCGLPLLKDEASAGFIGFDMVRRAHRWREAEVLPFQAVAANLGTALRRWQAEAELAASRNFLRTLFDAIPTPVFYKGIDGRYLGVNRGFEAFFGAERAVLLGKTAAEITSPELARTYMEQDERLLRTGGSQRYASRVRNARGELREVIFHKAVYTDADGRTAGLIGTVTDMTDTKQQERLLLLRSKRDEALLELPTLAERVDETAFMQRGQELAEELTESRIAFIHFLDEAAGTIELITWSRRTLADYCDAAADRHYPLREAGIWADGVRERAVVVCNDYASHPAPHGLPDGHAPLSRFISAPVIEDGRVVMLAGVGNKPTDYDATDVETLQLIANEIWRVVQRRRNLDVLERSANVFSHAREGIVVAGPDGTIIDVNAAMSEMTGYTRAELIGQNPRLYSSGRQSPQFYAALWRALREHGYWRGELWNRRKDGTPTAQLVTISSVRQPGARTTQFVALYSDINAIKDYQARLEHLAHYDSLTELPNRVLMTQQLKTAMAAADRDGARLAVLYIDLDGFKVINDTYGHDRGDQVLRMLAGRMRLTLHEGDSVGRLGGDELAIVLTDLPGEHEIAREVQRLLDAVVQPMALDGTSLQVSASIGVTFYPQTAAADADLLLRQADHAMYQAKQSGRNRFVVFDAEDERHQAHRRQMQQQIALGLERGELMFCLQPKVNMRSGEVLGAECLVRWNHPDRGQLAPHAFLHDISDSTLMADVGRLGISMALHRLESWHAHGRTLTLSVNIHAHHLQQPDFVAWLETQLARHPGLPRGALLLEVLESSALEDLNRVSRIIEACRAIGVDFSLDDFGTGYSSLAYLRGLPAAELKIDQSFVRNCLDDAEDLAILEGVLGLATAFRRRVVAEGVETIAHGEMLLALGCELGQGYAIARPMPPADFETWMGRWRVPDVWRNARAVGQEALPLLFAGVEHRAWIAAVERSLLDRDPAPAPTALDCRFGEWLAGHGREHFGAARAYRRIEQNHARIHALAAELSALSARGQGDAAAARLPELRRLRAELLTDLSALLPATGGLLAAG